MLSKFLIISKEYIHQLLRFFYKRKYTVNGLLYSYNLICNKTALIKINIDHVKRMAPYTLPYYHMMHNDLFLRDSKRALSIIEVLKSEPNLDHRTLIPMWNIVDCEVNHRTNKQSAISLVNLFNSIYRNLYFANNTWTSLHDTDMMCYLIFDRLVKYDYVLELNINRQMMNVSTVLELKAISQERVDELLILHTHATAILITTWNNVIEDHLPIIGTLESRLKTTADNIGTLNLTEEEISAVFMGVAIIHYTKIPNY